MIWRHAREGCWAWGRWRAECWQWRGEEEAWRVRRRRVMGGTHGTITSGPVITPSAQLGHNTWLLATLSLIITKSIVTATASLSHISGSPKISPTTFKAPPAHSFHSLLFPLQSTLLPLHHHHRFRSTSQLIYPKVWLEILTPGRS